jgi:hypothetical protein
MIIDDINAKIRRAKGAPVSFDWEGYLEESIGIPRKLLESLLNEDDDWTFIVKIHGIIETGLNHMLLVSLGHPELRKIISKMDTSSGKLAFIKALKLLPDDARMFVRVLSTVRNAAVHDTKNFTISLIEYEMGLDSEQRRNWKAGLGFSNVESATIIADPRVASLHGCTLILAHALKHELLAVTKRQLHTTMNEGIRELAQAKAREEARKRKKKRVKAKAKKH